jgi:hypothetical protein
MTVTLREETLGELRWIVLRGPAREAFGALGAHLRGEVTSFVDGSLLLPWLRRHVAAEPGRQRLAAVQAASQAGFPEAWEELAALADGAGASLDDLALLNFRGDLGRIERGTGCSDLAWRRRSSVIAHNEDGEIEEHGRCALLTLAIDGHPTVTALWYPVFLPSNAFTVTGDGLVWTIDSLTVAAPGAGAGRHFVGRGLQRSARTVDDAVDYLRTHPSAGGFGYTIGDRAGRVVGVDAGAGLHGWAEIGPDGRPGPLAWHTNHPRYIPGPSLPASDSSARRGEVLASIDVPRHEPDAGWFLRILAGAPPPGGVRVDPAGAGGGATLCTFVADLTAGEAVVMLRGASPVAIPLRDLAAGRAGRQRPVAFQPDLAQPDLAQPDRARPDRARPDLARPDLARPDLARPDLARPDLARPDPAAHS